MPEDLILDHRMALGDTIALTALVRDIQAEYPGRFNLGVVSHHKPLWANNPHITLPTKRHSKTSRRVEIAYVDGITAAGQGKKIHYLSAYHRDFKKKTGLDVPLRYPKGDMHLSADEATKPLVSGRYWVIVAGGKDDFTNKHWSYPSYQETVDILRGFGIRFVQAGASHAGHVHAKLTGVLDLIGQTENLRDLLCLIKHAEGIVCPITGLMHLSACFDKPCVVVAGGREEPWWEAYVNAYGAFGKASAPVLVEHRFLHTLGLIHCSQQKGCWKKWVVPIKPDHVKPANKIHLCKEPRRLPNGQAIAHCMAMISPNHVVEAVLSYYEQGILPPIGC